MFWWDEKASELQQKVRFSERDQSDLYDQDDVAKATVHMREDLVLVVSHLSSLNRQIATVKWAAVITAIVLVYIAVRLSH
jgi:hypothetical protein